MTRTRSRRRRRFFAALVVLIVLGAAVWFVRQSGEGQEVELAAYRGPLSEARGRTLTVPASDGELALFVAGDTIITQPWSSVQEPAFLRLIEEIRGADIAIGNLETVIHDYRGYAQAESGGSWMASPPKIADELIWAGFDIMAHANNHTFDYGSIGVLETHENAGRVGLVLAGSGKDLQRARAPQYFRHGEVTVGLVSMASTFVSFGQASRSRPDLHGRPGLNPLTVESGMRVKITRDTAERLQALAQSLGFTGSRFVDPEFDILGVLVRVADGHGLEWGKRLNEKDRDANLAAIGEAADNADIVVASLHEHWQRDGWLQDFARQAIDAGADIFLNHGPHVIRGMEIYKGRPIFYGLGDFVFEPYQMERLPSDGYEQFALDDDATPRDLVLASSDDGTVGLAGKRATWEGVVASLRVKDDRLIELRLLPVDLGFSDPLFERGRPRLAAGDLARSIIGTIADQSRSYGTEVEYVETGAFGVVRLN